MFGHIKWRYKDVKSIIAMTSPELKGKQISEIPRAKRVGYYKAESWNWSYQIYAVPSSFRGVELVAVAFGEIK